VMLCNFSVSADFTPCPDHHGSESVTL
jgi:hypothetical protein